VRALFLPPIAMMLRWMGHPANGGLAAAKDLVGEFGAGGEEGEGGGGEPSDAAGGDGEDVPGVGGDRRQEVRGGGGCGVGDECGQQCAGEFAELQVGERD